MQGNRIFMFHLNLRLILNRAWRARLVIHAVVAAVIHVPGAVWKMLRIHVLVVITIIMVDKMIKNPIKIVAELPDLMQVDDYREAASVKKVRFRLTLSDGGLEILGDSLYVEPLERLLRLIGNHSIERSLCG